MCSIDNIYAAKLLELVGKVKNEAKAFYSDVNKVGNFISVINSIGNIAKGSMEAENTIPSKGLVDLLTACKIFNDFAAPCFLFSLFISAGETIMELVESKASRTAEKITGLISSFFFMSRSAIRNAIFIMGLAGVAASPVLGIVGPVLSIAGSTFGIIRTSLKLYTLRQQSGSGELRLQKRLFWKLLATEETDNQRIQEQYQKVMALLRGGNARQVEEKWERYREGIFVKENREGLLGHKREKVENKWKERKGSADHKADSVTAHLFFTTNSSRFSLLLAQRAEEMQIIQNNGHKEQKKSYISLAISISGIALGIISLVTISTASAGIAIPFGIAVGFGLTFNTLVLGRFLLARYLWEEEKLPSLEAAMAQQLLKEHTMRQVEIQP